MSEILLNSPLDINISYLSNKLQVLVEVNLGIILVPFFCKTTTKI